MAVAIAKTAIDIASEATTVADHANRAAFAKAVLQNPGLYTGAFTIALTSEGLDQATATDTAIRNMVATVWNGFSG